ncbi:MAG: hypothetical protein ACI3VY_03155 [Faecousia sp.]
MKKLFILLLSVCLLLCLCACDRNAASASAEAPESTAATELLPQENPESTAAESSDESVSEEVREDILPINYASALSYRDESGVIRVLGIAWVVNTTDAPLALPACTMDFTDTNGNIVCSADSVSAYPPVIAPNESAYYYEKLEPDLADTCDLILSLTVPEPTSADVIRYEVGEITINDSPYGGLVLSSQVTNTTAETGELVCVAVVLFGESDEPLAVVQTVLMEPLAAGQTVDFYIEDFLLPAELTSDAVTSVQAFAYPL